MKSSFPVTCNCGYQTMVETTGSKDPEDFRCPACGTPFWFVQPLGNVVGMKIFNRALVELKSKDFTLAIVLSAIGVECELGRLFMKWNEVDTLDSRTPTQADTDGWAKQWSKPKFQKKSAQILR